MTAVTTPQEALTPPAPAAGAEPVHKRLTKVQMVLGAIVALFVAGLAGYGTFGSYSTIKDLATDHKLPSPEWVPAGIDGGLFGVLAMDLYFTWIGHPSAGLRMSARIFTVGTVVVNAMAGIRERIDAKGVPQMDVDWVALTLHIFAPVVLLVMVEAVRWLLMRLLKDDGKTSKYEKLGWVCWLTRPAPSFKTWKRMRISRIFQYAEAEDFESRRRAATARLKILYGKRWRTKAREDLVWGLRTVTRVEVLEALMHQVRALTGPGGEPSRGTRTPPGTPLGGDTRNPHSGSSRTPPGTPQGTPTTEGAGTPDAKNPTINGNPGPNAGNPPPKTRAGNPGGEPPGAPAGNPPADIEDPPSDMTTEELFRYRLGVLSEGFPDKVPGVKRIKTVAGVGYKMAVALQAALCAERGVEPPSAESDNDVSDPLLAGAGI